MGLGLQHISFSETQAFCLQPFQFSFFIASQVSCLAHVVSFRLHFSVLLFHFRWWNDEIIFISLKLQSWFSLPEIPFNVICLNFSEMEGCMFKNSGNYFLGPWANFRGNFPAYLINMIRFCNVWYYSRYQRSNSRF